MKDRIEASWLSIRRDADSTAREASLPLVRALASRLAALGTGPGRLSFVDVGAGTGANAEWLAPQVSRALLATGTAPMLQHWKLLDHDRALLDARRVALAGDRYRVSEHEGTVAEISSVLATRGDHTEGAVGEAGAVVTCSALLDLLTRSEIAALVAAAVGGADAALFALSVTGDIAIDPADADDDLIATLFNAHQQRPSPAGPATSESAAGPAGWQVAVSEFEASGWAVELAQTPWQLGPAAAVLSARLLSERAEAAAQMAPEEATRLRVDGWRSRRRRQRENLGLQVTVNHVDMLALPPRSTSVQMSSPSA